METKTVDPEVTDYNKSIQGSCVDVDMENSPGSIGRSTVVRLSKVLIFIFHR